jgi:type I restriction enzyme, R subunit
MVDISEKSLEQSIEATLLVGGPDAYPGGEGLAVEPLDRYENAPGGYRRRKPDDYNKELCLDPGMTIDFILATQPKVWERLKQHHGSEVKERFLKRLSSRSSGVERWTCCETESKTPAAPSSLLIFGLRAG